MPKVPTKHTSNGSVPSLDAKIRKAKVPQPRKEPLWKGPEVDGITYSLLSRFLCCRERFRLLVVEGLKAEEGFSHRMEYGNMFHICEEATAGGNEWQEPLLLYAKDLVDRYGAEASGEIDKWYQICKQQYPVYLEYWSKHSDVKRRKQVYQEETFDVPYKLPSGRTVRLRGKWDSVDIIDKALWIQENKTKGEVNIEQLTMQLPLDLQSNMYLIALAEHQKQTPSSALLKMPIGGVRYNVVRRPLGFGKHSISQRKGLGKAKTGAETPEEFYDRLGGLIKDNPADFFARLKMGVHPFEIEKFKKVCLDPLLEQLCDWWEWAVIDPFNPWRSPLRATNGVLWENTIHWLHPYGVYNSLNEGRFSDVDAYIATGNERGLARIEQLFTELQVA